MTGMFTWLATILVAVLLVSFVAYLVSPRRLPTARRSEIDVYDRLGHRVARTEISPPDRR